MGRAEVSEFKMYVASRGVLQYEGLAETLPTYYHEKGPSNGML